MDYFAQIELGLRIKMLRTEKGLTQEKLAEALGISLEHIGKIERGNVQVLPRKHRLYSSCQSQNN